MGFRTLELSQAAEVHIKNGQLEISTADGVVMIPIEDLNQIMVHGANIRLSTMDLSILSQNKVSLITLDEKYLPTAIVLPFEGHSRQSKLMHAQIHTEKSDYLDLWIDIIQRKILNQSRALSILGSPGAESIAILADQVTDDNADLLEAKAAKKYFEFYHKGLNRRIEDPVNSRLNYGYAVVRCYIAGSLVMTGFHPTFGIHHNNQLNAFNLADDLIEPYRPIVDLTALACIGTNVRLTKSERQKMAMVLHSACIVDGTKVSVMAAVDFMIDSFKRIILEKSTEKLRLPFIIPLETIEGVTE